MSVIYRLVVRNHKPCTPKPETPLKNEKSLTLNVDVINLKLRLHPPTYDSSCKEPSQIDSITNHSTDEQSYSICSQEEKIQLPKENVRILLVKDMGLG